MKKSTAGVKPLLVGSSNWNLGVLRAYCCYWGGRREAKTVCRVIFVVNSRTKQLRIFFFIKDG